MAENPERMAESSERTAETHERMAENPEKITKNPEEITASIGRKKLRIFPGPPGSPVVYLNCFEAAEGDEVRALLFKEPSCPPHSLVLISGIDWDREMTPWPCPPLYRRSPAFSGEAESYLSLLAGTMIPLAESHLKEPGPRAVAGYSLAGLFALWSLYRTDLFRKAASVSGSLWYPGIVRFAETETLRRKPDCVYFSLGSAESSARNRVLRTVQENTGAIALHLSEAGIRTTFVLNPGNHFVNSGERTAAGILWMLREPG